MLKRLVEKAQYAHPYDNSDLDDLISDVIKRRPIGLKERMKRKMKYAYKTIVYFLTAFAVLAMFGGSAQAFSVPPKPDNGWYVRDMSGKLDVSSIRLLNQKIENFNQTKKNEIGVLVLPTTDDTSIDDAAKDVFHSWGIGKAGLDNGILIMIATSDRKIRIETGKGAEGDVTDVDSAKMINDLRPYLRKNDYAGGLSNTIDTITQLMEDRTGQKAIVKSTSVDSPQQQNVPASTTPATNNDDENAAGTAMLVVLALFLGIPLAIIFFTWLGGRGRKPSYSSGSYDYRPPTRPDTYTPPRPPAYTPRPSTFTAAVTGAAAGAAVATHTHKKHHHSSGSSSSSSSSSYTPSSSSSDSSSSYSSSSSSDSSPSYSPPPDFGGGGFGGGDSGGGGASGDF